MTPLLVMPLFALLADDPTPDAHRLRIHADLEPLRLRMVSVYDHRSTQAQLGVPGSTASLGFGFAPHPMVLVGARVRGQLQVFHTESYGTTDALYGSIGLLPYLELRPLPRLRVQPFVLVEGGASYGGSRYQQSQWGGRSSHQEVIPSVAVRVGMHAFVLPRVSIDADLGAGHEWTIPVGGDYSPSSVSKGWIVTGTVGVSGWF